MRDELAVAFLAIGYILLSWLVLGFFMP